MSRLAQTHNSHNEPLGQYDIPFSVPGPTVEFAFVVDSES